MVNKFSKLKKDPRVNFAISLFKNEKELDDVIAEGKHRVRNLYEGFVLFTEIDYPDMPLQRMI